MMNSRLVQKALAFPMLLIAAVLALTGCVAPPAQVTTQTYATQPYTQSVETQQTYPSQGYPNQGYQNQGYPTQGYPAQGYPSQGYPTQTYQTQTYQTPTYQPNYFATICMAGNYTCPVPGNTPPGTNCACPGIGAPSYGVAQ
jgi:hypothetical protein